MAAVRQLSGSGPQRFDTAAIFSSASTAVPILVFHAVESAMAFTAVRQRFDKVWRMDHGLLSGQVQHGLGSRWPTAT